jgi:hypothetical protein
VERAIGFVVLNGCGVVHLLYDADPIVVRVECFHSVDYFARKFLVICEFLSVLSATLASIVSG